MILTDRPEIKEELRLIEAVLRMHHNVDQMALCDALRGLEQIRRHIENGRNWQAIATEMERSAKGAVENLKKYGKHLPECGQDVVGDDCACGFYTAYQGKPRGDYGRPLPHHRRCPCWACTEHSEEL